MATRTQNRPAVAAPGLTANDLLQILKANMSPGETMPEGGGWGTRAEYAKEWGLGLSQSGSLLRDGVAKGTVERFQGKTNGSVTYFYRAKPTL